LERPPRYTGSRVELHPRTCAQPVGPGSLNAIGFYNIDNS